MIKTLGLRAEPTKVTYTLTHGSLQVPILLRKGKLEGPNGAKEHETLSSIRAQLLDLIDQEKPSAIGVRTPETNSKNSSDGARRRLRVEGVLMEVGSTRRLQVLCGSLQTISSRLSVKKIKEQLKEPQFRGVDISQLSDEHREALAVGVALLPDEDNT